MSVIERMGGLFRREPKGVPASVSGNERQPPYSFTPWIGGSILFVTDRGNKAYRNGGVWYSFDGETCRDNSLLPKELGEFLDELFRSQVVSKNAKKKVVGRAT